LIAPLYFSHPDVLLGVLSPLLFVLLFGFFFVEGLEAKTYCILLFAVDAVPFSISFLKNEAKKKMSQK